MVSEGGFWSRVSGEVRHASERAGRGARRAVQRGVLGVDLVSLRHDRSRALAHLGERVVRLWSAGSLEALTLDAEAVRLRALVESINASIRAKEDELRGLRDTKGGPAPAHASADPPASHEPQATSAP
jgi:hypothetical protein